MPNGVIDITDAVEDMRTTFVKMAVVQLIALELAVPGLKWVALPVIRRINELIITWVIENLSQLAVMQAFFLNTAIRKPSQAKDFTASVKLLNNLPEDATDEDIKKAEQKKMDDFAALVALTN